jgi:hypothetical protein
MSFFSNPFDHFWHFNPSHRTIMSLVKTERKVAFAALHHRDYRRYFLVSLFSTMGDNIEHVISYSAAVPEISLPGAWRLCGHQPLDPFSIVRGLFRRAR